MLNRLILIAIACLLGWYVFGHPECHALGRVIFGTFIVMIVATALAPD